MDQQPPQPVPAESAMPCCCAQCGAAFDPRTQQQIRILQRFAELGLGLAEAVAEFPLRTRHIDADITQNYELLTRGARRSLALECKITEDARRRHQREAHGAPPPREREPGELGEPPPRPLPLVTTEDVESVIGPEPVVRETAETVLRDAHERLRDRFVDHHTPAVVAASIVRDLNVEGADLTVFLEPAPTRDDPWVRAEAVAAAAEAEPREVPGSGDPGSADPGSTAPRPAETGDPPDRPPPGAKGRDPP